MTKFNAEILNSAGTLVTAFATVLLALATILLARATSRLNKISEELKATQHSAALTQAFNVQNSLALSSDANLMVADSLIAPEDTSHTIEGARERWMSFVLLNVQALIFASRDQDATFREIWEAARHGVLDHLLRNESVMNLLRTRGYAREFVDYCEARRKEIGQVSSEGREPHFPKF